MRAGALPGYAASRHAAVRFTDRILIAAIALALSPALSRAGSITGRFVEKPANTPLAGVEMVVRHAADSTVVAHGSTSTDGRCRFDSLPLGRYLLRASLLGHVPFLRSDVALSEQAPDLDLGTQAMAVSPVSVGGVSVHAERATAVIAADRNIYLTKDMPAATSGTATDILRTVPELDVDIDGHVSLRGSSSVNIQFNGRAAPMKGDALTTYLRQFPASRIERIEVIANPSAKFDPEGTAGIVNIVLKDNVDLGLSGSVYVTAGQRFSGPGARVAWQKGPLTFFSGVSGYLGGYQYQYDTARQNLLALPVSSFASATSSDYKSGNGSFDASLDYAANKRSTIYGTVNSYLNSSDNDAHAHYTTVLDSAQVATSRYDRTDAGSYGGHTVSVTLGVQHVVQKGRDERTIELLQSDTDNDSHGNGLQRTLVPTGQGDQPSRQQGLSGYHERSLEIDDTHPLGAHGKLEAGYHGSDRHTTSSSLLTYPNGDTLVATPLNDVSDYVHHELFHAGYLTLGSTLGRLSLQIGARGELATTTFDVRSTGHSYDNDYRSLFPSANAAWDFGKGRTVRLSYSKRIERPSAGYLNPDVPSTDSLNRFVGNPGLKPKYTHSYTLDASWVGSRGSLRLSPYYRETVDNWDQVTRADAAGVATTTWLNASSVRFLGTSLTASLRQTKRLGGTLSVSVFREHHDASNLSDRFRQEATNWSANGNVAFKTTQTLDLQGYLRYSPAQTLAQGQRSAYTYTSLGSRLKIGQNASASLWLSDPFNLAHYVTTTGDATYAQTSTSHWASRGFSFTLTWTWGKPPEEKPRRQTSEQPQQDAPVPRQ